MTNCWQCQNRYDDDSCPYCGAPKCNPKEIVDEADRRTLGIPEPEDVGQMQKLSDILKSPRKLS